MSDTIHKMSLPDACARFVHRFTMEHVPNWAAKPYNKDEQGRDVYYAPQFRTDSEWYRLTARFPGDPGLSANAKYCEGGMPTWPMGKELTRPYTRTAAAAARQLGKRFRWQDWQD